MSTNPESFGESGTAQVTIVGVGASAGGLAALKALLDHTPPDRGIAYILVQHLDPTHESVMAELLDKRSEMPVREIAGDEAVEANRVYVIPPDRYVELEGDHLRLRTPEDERGRRMAVDALFRSLAKEMGRSAIGVVLTGTGADGTAGLKEIKAAGGLTLAQDPDEAEHAGMPRSAVDEHAVDRVLPIEAIAQTILGYVDHPYRRSSGGADGVAEGVADGGSGEEVDVASEIEGGEAGDLKRVLGLVRDEAGVDLSGYRPSTILRRIHRRMGLNQIQTLSAYVDRLRGDREELGALSRDMHINVTDFFRDAEAFEALREKAAPRLLEHAEEASGDARAVRVWVPGCATGEEAYSIAMTLLEAREERDQKRPVKLQIFATDVDSEAVRVARHGVFPEGAMTNVSPARRGRFFEPLDEPGRYRVKGVLRDMITFATHDVLSDPPFSRLDLISCRNLLIYLDKEAKESTLHLFHFSLRKRGFLLLGPSESLGDQAESFRSVSKRWRLFERLDRSSGPRRPLRHFSASRLTPEREHRGARREERASERSRIERLIAQKAAPASVLVGRDLDVLHLHGDLIEFLDLPQGGAELSLVEMLREELRTRVQAALYRAAREGETVESTGRMTARSGEAAIYEVVVRPVEDGDLGEGLLLVSFERRPAEESEGEPSGDSVSAELERELAATRSDLQSTVAELENANQELRSSSEEAMTMNEELQSSNEELETQHEELRSVNEELSTLNAQLREKIDESQRTQTDLANFFTSARFAAVFLGREDYELRRYTPEAGELLGFKESDVGQTMRYFVSRPVAAGLLEDAQRVVDELTSVERDVEDGEGSCFLRTVLPYRTQEDRIDGVVVTFTDVTRLRQLTEELERQRVQQAAISRIGTRAVSEDDFEKLLRFAVRVVAETIGAPKVHVLQLTSDRSGALEVASTGWPSGAGEGSDPLELDAFARHVAETTGPVVVEEMAEEPRYAETDLVREQKVQSAAGIEIPPLVGKPVALLAVYSAEPRAFDERDQSFLQQVATVLSNALQRRRAEEELRKSEERFRTLADNISQLAWMADENGWIFWYNRRWYDYTGTTLEQMRGWGWKSVHHPDHVDRVVRKLQHSWDTGEPWEDIFPLRSKTGEYRWFLSRAVPIRDENGEIVRWFGTNTDITVQRRLEQAAQRARDRLQAIIDNAPAAIYAKNRSGEFVLSNRTHAEVLGASPEEVLGRTDADFPVSAEGRHEYATNDARVWATGEPIEVEERVPTPDGERVFISLKFPLRTGEGETYAVCGVSTDITDRNAAQEHLQLVMAELNHRVKNILAVVEAISERTADMAETTDEFRESFSQRLRSIAAAHSLLTKTDWHGVTVGDIIETELTPRAGAKEQLSLEGPRVVLTPHVSIAMHMVVHELATNAAKYGALSASDGRLRVSWRLSGDGHEAARLRLDWRETGGDGDGRAKRVGYGTAMIDQVVEHELDGSIERELTRGGFSCCVEIPVGGRQAGRKLLRPASATSGDGATVERSEGAVVLLVEDRVLLAHRVAQELESAGYRVLGPAATLDEALVLVDGATIHAGLLDVDLNGARVYPVAEKLAERGVPFAFITGFTAKDLDARYRDRPVIEKPLDLESLMSWLGANV